MSSGEKAKKGAANLFAKARTEVFRTTQKAMVKMGKADETMDIQFGQESDKFTLHYKAVKKLKKDAAQLLTLLRDLTVQQATLADDLYQMYPTSAANYNATLKEQDIAKLIDSARLVFDETMRKDFLDPTSKYLGQFKEAKGRIAIRNTRLVDMDRYGRDVRVLQEKAGPHSKITVAEQKYEAAVANYQSLNDELLRDLPALYEDRIPYFDPLFATYTVATSEYYRQCAKSTAEILSYVSAIDRQAIHNHQRVIAPTEGSAATFKATVGSTLKSGHSSLDHNDPYADATAPPQMVEKPVPAHAPAPKPTPVPPSRAQKAKALYDFAAQEPNELGFKVGDIIILRTMKGDWWEGELNGKKGLLPSNYVELLH